jgi:AcrR family transcriptional regulator
MGQIRDARRTRERILRAAAGAIRRAGPNVSLDAIARTAEVSKGGLMHHFPTRERWMIALVESLYGDFEADVDAAVSKDDTGLGRLARAYIRASFVGMESSDEAGDSHLLLAQLASSPAARRYLEELDTRWHAALVEDGLHPRMARLVIAAVEGADLGEERDQVDAQALQQLERDLLALTRVAPAVLAVIDVVDPAAP